MCNYSALRQQNVALERAWPAIREHAEFASKIQQLFSSKTAPSIPDSDASGANIRSWILSHTDLIQNICCLALTRLGLTHLPAEIAFLTGLNTLIIGGNPLISIPPGIFAGMKLLTSLTIRGSQLTSIPLKLLEHLPHLTSLNLQENPLLTLLPGQLSPLRKLSDLTIDAHLPGRSPSDTVSGLPALHKVHLYIDPRIDGYAPFSSNTDISPFYDVVDHNRGGSNWTSSWQLLRIELKATSEQPTLTTSGTKSTAPTLSTMPDEIFEKITQFETPFVLRSGLVTVSSRFWTLALHSNAANIRLQCSRNSFRLYQLISKQHSRFGLLFHRTLITFFNYYNVSSFRSLISPQKVIQLCQKAEEQLQLENKRQ
jgi:hypothetical protein